MLGEQAVPVISEEPPPELMWILFFSRVSAEIGNATDEVGTSRIASTLSLSYQLRAMLTPTSGLFW
ncbi:hypothetical protein ACVIST_006358 [Bradyrhizobium elkanii]